MKNFIPFIGGGFVTGFAIGVAAFVWCLLTVNI